MRIALIGTNIVPKSQIGNPMQYNIALYYLASYLKRAVKDIEIEILDLPICIGGNRLYKEYVEKINDIRADIFGFSSYCWDKEIILKIIKIVKRLNRGSKIVIGGPTATYEGYELMKRYNEIDYAVIGEGELVLENLVKSKGCCNGNEIEGLIYRKGTNIKFGSYAKPISNLDIIPSPYTNGLLKPNKMNLMLGFSRGCVNRCKHCAWKYIGGGLRCFSKERIVEELIWARENRYKHIFIYDSSINTSTKRLEEISSAIKQSMSESALSFTYFIDHTRWNKTQKRLLENINTRCAMIGLESISKNSSHSLGRRPVEKRKFLYFIKDITGIAPVMISVMLGIPTETFKDFKDTIDYVVSLVEKFGNDRIIGIRIFWTIIPPGSKLALEANKYGIKYANKGMPYVLSSHFYTEKDMINSFMYIQNHNYKELFIWEDANPKRYFEHINWFELDPETYERYQKNS